MVSEHRADELKRKSKDELITLLLEAERQRNAAQHGLDMFHSREPGRYAFYCRHLALAYVRKANPELHQEVFSRACQAIDEQGGKSYQDVVAGLEAAIADLHSSGALILAFLDSPAAEPSPIDFRAAVESLRAALGEKNDAT